MTKFQNPRVLLSGIRLRPERRPMDWTRIMNRRNRIIGWATWKRRQQRILREETRIVGGMRHYFEACLYYKRRIKGKMSKLRLGHGEPINRPVKHAKGSLYPVSEETTSYSL